MSAEKLMGQLGDKLGISDLNMTEDNTCGVLFDSDDVLFECSHGNLFIVSEIGRVEEDEKEKMFKIFMETNHLVHATAFGSIGYDGERDIFTFLLMTLRLSLQNYQ
ncbi:type III secretion system chaperone [Succinivibrio sp.]|uniref:type III secretion system chaperone n=1 Tax=Succinivibrio sp. TaxID=2053619 RepID=UPI00386BEBA2